MKKEFISELFKKFEDACYDYEGIECWSARELQNILGYSQWRNFKNVIEKAEKSCEQAGEDTKNHFAEFSKMVEIGSGAQKLVEDIALTRYACYLIAQNGDATTKSEIAFAQTYFAVQTRKQEIIEKRLLDVARVTAREKLSQSEKKLSGIIFERGVDNNSFAIIRSKGDQALFGGRTTNDMKRILKVPANRPLADFLPTLTIKAKVKNGKCFHSTGSMQRNALLQNIRTTLKNCKFQIVNAAHIVNCKFWLRIATNLCQRHPFGKIYNLQFNIYNNCLQL